MAEWFYNDGQATGSNNGSSWENAFQSAYTVPGTLAANDNLHFKEHTGIDGTSNALTFAVRVNIYGGYTSTLTGTTTGSQYQTGQTIFDGSNTNTTRALAFSAGFYCSNITVQNYQYSSAPILNLSLESGILEFENCIFKDCASTDPSDDISGINITYATLTLTNCEIDSLTGGSHGAIMMSYGTLYSDGCYFHDCTGYVYNGSAIDSFGSHLYITDTVFTGNEGTFGTIHSFYGTIDISRSIINADTTTYGIVHTEESCVVTIDNSIFVDCQQDYTAVLRIKDTGTLQVTNSTFANNTCVNEVPGAIFTAQDPYIANCIFWNNSGTAGNGSQILSAGAGGTVTYCDVTDLSTTGISGITTITNCIDIDPQFVGSGDYPYDLSASSPETVTRGASTSVTGYETFDFHNDTRSLTQPSMGADEYPSASAGWTNISAIRYLSASNFSSLGYLSKDSVSSLRYLSV